MSDQERNNYFDPSSQRRQQFGQGRTSSSYPDTRRRSAGQDAGEYDAEFRRRGREGREYLSDNDEIYDRNQYGASDDGFRYERERFGEESLGGSQSSSYGREQGLNRSQGSHRMGMVPRHQRFGSRNETSDDFGGRQNQYSPDSQAYQRYDYQEGRNSYRPYSELGASYPNYGQESASESGQWGQGSEQNRSRFAESSARSVGQHSGRGPKGYQRSDERIREEVSDALTEHPGIDASEVEVKVEQGELTLTGTVDCRRAKRLAEDALEHIRGVRDIHNHLRVRSSSEHDGSKGLSATNAGSQQKDQKEISGSMQSSATGVAATTQKKPDSKSEQKLHA
jgi:osmotically-inducible protein OsmY